MIFKLKLHILIFVSISLFAYANEDISFNHITQSQGLPSNNIFQILQDSTGLMWFATYNGLASYDGYNFKVFNYSPNDSTTINHDLVLCLTEQSSRYLLAGTYRGFCRLDKKLNKFERFTSKKLQCITETSVRKIVIDSIGNLWLASNKGLAIYNIESDSVIIFKHDPNNPSTICSDFLLDIYFDKNNQLWIGTRDGLDVYNLKTKTFTHIFKNQEFVEINEYEGGILAITRYFDRYYTKSSVDLNFEKKEYSKNKPGFVFTDVLTHYKGANWYSIREYGILRENLKDGSFTSYTYNKYQPSGINSSVPQCIFNDSDDNLWIGTFDGGVNFYSPHRKIFNNMKENFMETGLRNNKVRVIYQDNDDDIWVGTKVGGTLARFDMKTQTFEHFTHNPKVPSSLSDEYIFAITDAKPGYLWVGTMMGGLNLFNKKTGDCQIFKHNKNNPKTISSNNIKALLMDNGKLWISHHRLGVDLYDPIKNSLIKNYQTSSDSNDISSNSINIIFKDSRNNIWFGSMSGLCQYNRQKDNFIRFSHNNENPTSISDNMVLCFLEDKSDNLWIGTKNGLNRYNFESKKFEVYNTSNGLSANSIYGIAEDDYNNLWISTNVGICKFDWRKRASILYTKEDGLQNNEFVPGVYETTNDKYIFFGGNEGFTYFNPIDIKANPNIPNVIFTDFRIFNKSVEIGGKDNILDKHISYAKKIKLSYIHSVFSFEFTALNYNSTSKNEYAYKMEGFDIDWQEVGTNRTATYTNLNPGNYVFKVKASNNDGLWNEKGVSIKITITPPWWETLWFRILLIFSFLGTISSIFIVRSRMYQNQKNLLEKKVKERTIKLDLANIELRNQKEEILFQNKEIQQQTIEIVSQRDEIKKQKESLEKESKKLQILNQFGQELTHILNLEAINNTIYNYISSILDTSFFGIGLYSENKKSLIFSSFIEKGKPNKDFRVSLNDKNSCAIWCYKTQIHIFSNDFENDYPKYIKALKEKESILSGSLIYLTLTVKDKKIGVITVQSYNKNAYSKNDLEALQTLASYLAIALDNANTHKIVRNQKNELERQHNILEEQVKERTKDLEAAKLKAEESDKLKSSFLANMSHEIRTPLNAIVGFSHVIVSDDYKNRDKKRMYQLIENSSASLLNIINDIIDFSKIEAAQMDVNLSAIDIDLILNQLFQTYTIQLDKAKKSDQIELFNRNIPLKKNPILLTDSERLKQILNNLLSNAIKFTQKGKIEFGYKEIKEGFITLYVKDSGIGIEKKNLAIIFDRFRKIEEDSKAVFRGTGLGLTITKYLVKLLGGEIWVESDYNKGSEFIFTLPLNVKQNLILEEVITSKDQLIKIPDWHEKTILIVEDETSNYSLIEVFLENTQINKIWAKDGLEAIKLFKSNSNKIDLVLLDIKLPKKNGFEVLYEIKKIKNDVIVIAQTAYAMANDEIRIKEAGFIDYISKPIDQDKLLEVIAYHLK